MNVGVPNDSAASLREGLANAPIHRDHTRNGGAHVQWRANRIDISNLCGLPEGVRLDKLLTTPPRPRDPLSTDARKRAGGAATR